MRRLLHVAPLMAAFLFAAEPASAAVGFRQLTTAYPCAVQSGTTSVVQLRSNFTLDGAYQSFFVPAGPSMKLAEPKPIDAPYTGRGRPGTPFKFEVTVPAKQLPGLYEFRLATKQAVSSVADLLVTDYPVVLELTKENGAREKAQQIEVPAALCGICDPAEDVDCYRFQGRSGDQLTFQIYAQRITQSVHDMVGRSGYHMDSILTLLSPTGQVVAMNDNYFGGDALLTAKLSQDGEYVLTVRDTRYGGDPRYSYCVEISRGFPALATFPLVIEQQKSTEVDVLTVGGKALGTTTLKPAAEQAAKTERARLTVGGKPTNPLEYGVSPVPQLVHNEAGAQAKPRVLELPSGVNCRLETSGDAHWFAFDGAKDAYYLLQADARRYRLPLDVLLEVFDAQGKKLAEADDLPLSTDAKLYFKAPADGRYLVQIRDLHGRGGPEFFYHLSVEKSGPDFELTGKSLYYAMLAPGTRALWFVSATRLNGFDGPIDLRVEGLPAGVKQVPVRIPSGMNFAPLVLEADAKAKVGASLVKIVGRAELPGNSNSSPAVVEHEAVVVCELQSQGGSQGHWPVHSSLVGVVEKLDLTKVEATPSEITLQPGGKAEINVTIARNPEYKDPVGLEFTWVYFGNKLGEQLPPGVTLGKGSSARLSGNTLTGKLILEAKPDAVAVERFPIAVMAGVSISFSIDTKYASNPIYLTIPGADKKKPANVAKK